ncbi:hypothetical protein [Nocardioides sp.]|uniref:hypothetical protein n=1 Tax=Nocardioides sp. TaxID=35761 RepID=UPI003566068C
MVVVGFVLIALGALAIVSAVFATSSTGTVEFLSIDVSPLALFLVGLGAGVAIMWGFAILKFGTKRGLARRKEHRRLADLSEKLDKVEAERRHDIDRQEEKDRPSL